MKQLFGVVAALLAEAVVAIVVVSAGLAIWPGAMKLTAPTLCPAGQPDAFVISTTTTSSDGSSTSFSLFCMGERGDFTEAGTWRPYGLLFLGTWGILVALTLLLLVRAAWRSWRRAARAGVPDPDPTSALDAGPVSPID